MSFGMAHQIGVGRTTHICPPSSGIVNSFRYVRFSLGRSDKNAGSYLNQLQVIDTDGVNRALGRHEYLTPAGTEIWASYPLKEAFNGSIVSNKTWGLGYHKKTHILDLGSSYVLSEVRMYPYYADGRTFQDVGIEISNDQETWYLIHDSEADGTTSLYHGRQAGTAEGLVFDISAALVFLQGIAP